MTYELPKTILERFLSKKFVILGRAGLDLYPNPIGLSTQDADNFISDLKKKYEVEIKEVEIIKENITFKIPNKLN